MFFSVLLGRRRRKNLPGQTCRFLKKQRLSIIPPRPHTLTKKLFFVVFLLFSFTSKTSKDVRNFFSLFPFHIFRGLFAPFFHHRKQENERKVRKKFLFKLEKDIFPVSLLPPPFLHRNMWRFNQITFIAPLKNFIFWIKLGFFFFGFFFFCYPPSVFSNFFIDWKFSRIPFQKKYIFSIWRRNIASSLILTHIFGHVRKRPKKPFFKRRRRRQKKNTRNFPGISSFPLSWKKGTETRRKSNKSVDVFLRRLNLHLKWRRYNNEEQRLL